MENILTLLASSKSLEDQPPAFPHPHTHPEEHFVNHKPVAIESGQGRRESATGKGLLSYSKSWRPGWKADTSCGSENWPHDCKA